MPKLSFILIYRASTFCREDAETLRRLCAVKGVSCTGVLEVPDGPTSFADRLAGRILPRVHPVSIASVLPEAQHLDAQQPVAADVILDLSGAVHSPTQIVARLGIWRIRYGAGDPAAVREMARGSSTLVVQLEQSSPGTRTTVLETAVVNVVPASYQQSLSLVRTAGADLPARAVKRWRETGVWRESAGAVQERRAVAPGELLQFLARRCLAWIKSQISTLFLCEMWNVGIVRQPIERFLEPGFQPAIEWLPQRSSKHYLADPFLAEVNGEIRLLMEEFDYDRYQGYIVDQAPDPCAGPPAVIIDEQVHMSYPFPVRHQGNLYAIPESQRRREVALYRWEAGRWLRAATLLRDFSALDSTVFEWNGKWWMMNTCQDDLPECKLFIWHAEDLFGPWTPHALNPVKCDVRGSRPGGAPFVHNGVLYRPAQDSSESYGGALTINRIHSLTENEFEEEPVLQLPRFEPYSDGLHTLSGAGGITVIDGKKMTFVREIMSRRFKHKWRRLTGRAK